MLKHTEAYLSKAATESTIRCSFRARVDHSAQMFKLIICLLLTQNVGKGGDFLMRL